VFDVCNAGVEYLGEEGVYVCHVGGYSRDLQEVFSKVGSAVSRLSESTTILYEMDGVFDTNYGRVGVTYDASLPGRVSVDFGYVYMNRNGLKYDDVVRRLESIGAKCEEQKGVCLQRYTVCMLREPSVAVDVKVMSAGSKDLRDVVDVVEVTAGGYDLAAVRDAVLKVDRVLPKK